MSTLHTLVHAATFIEEAAATITAGFAAMQEVTFMAAIIWGLNAFVHFTAKVYKAGEHTGRFYFKYLHHHVKWLTVRIIALIILLAQLTWEGAVVIYTNREQIRANIISGWHTIERAFTYESPRLY